jgi:hypothetical protein
VIALPSHLIVLVMTRLAATAVVTVKRRRAAPASRPASGLLASAVARKGSNQGG